MEINKKNQLINQFIDDLDELHVSLSDTQMNQFIVFYEMLIEYNKVMNLTAITEFEDVLKKHFVDSVSLIKAIDLNKELSVIDVGSGAGFPGIPLKIAFPNLNVTLLDSLNKRVSFLQEVIDTLHLKNANAIHGRAENFAKPNQLREKFDLAVSRAVANLSILTEYCIPYVKIGGNFISYKSEKIDEEIKDAKTAIEILGGCEKEHISFYLPNSNLFRSLCIIEKRKRTPEQYPRKAGTINKKPL